MPLTSPRFRRSSRLQQASVNQLPLKRGETSEAVEILQQAMIDLGFKMPISAPRAGVPDGIFGPETEQTVKKFQASQALTMDGIAGKNTLERLDFLMIVRESAESARLFAEVQSPPPIGPWHIS